MVGRAGGRWVRRVGAAFPVARRAASLTRWQRKVAPPQRMVVSVKRPSSKSCAMCAWSASAGVIFSVKTSLTHWRAESPPLLAILLS